MDKFKKLWTYDEDAIALAEALEIPVSKNSKGYPFLSLPASGIISRYDLEEIDNEDGAFFLPYEDDEESPDVDEEFSDEDEELPSSTWLVAELDSADAEHTVIVVEDPKEVNLKERIYLKSHPFAEALIEADVLHRNYFWHSGKRYCFTIFERTENYTAHLVKQRYFLHLSSQPETIYVYKKKSYSKDHNLKQITALVFFSREQQKPVKVSVYFSLESNEYFINLETLNSYRKKYGMPYILAAGAPGESFFNSSNMAEESIIHLYGYNVSQEEDLTAQERREILARLIDYEIVTKGEIQNHLEGLISLNQKNKNMCVAIEKWQEDLYYISTYNMGKHPEIWGDFYYMF